MELPILEKFMFGLPLHHSLSAEKAWHATRQALRLGDHRSSDNVCRNDGTRKLLLHFFHGKGAPSRRGPTQNTINNSGSPSTVGSEHPLRWALLSRAAESC